MTAAAGLHAGFNNQLLMHSTVEGASPPKLQNTFLRKLILHILLYSKTSQSFGIANTT